MLMVVQWYASIAIVIVVSDVHHLITSLLSIAVLEG